MTRSLFTSALLAGVLSVMPMAASAQNREHQQIFADLRMLQEQTQQLRVAVASLADALKAVTAKADEQTNLTRKLFADQGLQLGALADTSRILREKLDATNVTLSKDAHEMETLRQELANQRTLLTQIITLVTPAPISVPVDPTGTGAAGAAGTTGLAGTTGATPPATVTPPPTLPPPPPNPERVFNSAFGDYMTGQYDMAILGFEQFIKTFPTSPEVAKARFHIAESHYGKGAYREAVLAYEQVVNLHKGTDLEPQALYKQGLAYEQLGQPERAKANWELVRKAFPDSSAAMLAAQNLARIIK
jgi:tol-pal system protein YbgF